MRGQLPGGGCRVQTRPFPESSPNSGTRATPTQAPHGQAQRAKSRHRPGLRGLRGGMQEGARHAVLARPRGIELAWDPADRMAGAQTQAPPMGGTTRYTGAVTPPPVRYGVACLGRRGGGALEGKGPQRRPQKRLGRWLEGVAKAVGGGYSRLQMPLKLALGVRGTVAGHGLGALEGGEGGTSPPSNASLGGGGGVAGQREGGGGVQHPALRPC